MTEKFEQFITDTFNSLVSEGDAEQDPAAAAVVDRVGGMHNQKSAVKKVLANPVQKRAGRAVKNREKAQKARLPKMLDNYERDTAGILNPSV